MPNGGLHHCGHCNHFKYNNCQLRNIEIQKSHWTTCRNWNKESSSPNGHVFAIVGIVKNGAGGYTELPYYQGNRVDTFQEGSGDTVIRFTNENGETIEVSDVDSYMELWNKKHLK